MQVQFIAPCKDLSGGIKVIAEFAQRLMDRGHQVRVIYPGRPLSLKRRIKDSARRLILGERDHLDRFKGELLRVDRVDALSVPEADVTIASSFETAEWIRDLGPRHGRRFYFIQGYEVWNADAERVEKTYRLPYEKITVSRWLQKLLLKKSGDGLVHLIPNASDLSGMVKISPDSDKKYDLGMVYSAIPNKGSSHGLNVIKALSEKYPQLRCVLFGTDRPDVLPANCTFYHRPSRRKIASIYSSTRIWMSTSYREGFCLPCLEAMSCGSVAVSTDNLGVRDMVTDNVNGYIVPVADEDMLLARTEKLLNDPALRMQMAELALQKSRSFSWEVSADRFESLISRPVTERKAS